MDTLDQDGNKLLHIYWPTERERERERESSNTLHCPSINLTGQLELIAGHTMVAALDQMGGLVAFQFGA